MFIDTITKASLEKNKHSHRRRVIKLFNSLTVKRVDRSKKVKGALKPRPPLERPTLGYTSVSTAMLDLDDCTFRTAFRWAEDLDRRFDLEGFMILQSSHRDYHVVFNRRLIWRDVLRVIFACRLCTKRWGGRFSWAEMQAIKGAATLRISNKGRKPTPKIVHRQGWQNHEVRRYLSVRRAFAGFGRGRGLLSRAR